ncbi:SusC/RagA family TonB-linked outer membrane protein [soil metagenome]
MSQHLARWTRLMLAFVLTVGVAYAQTGTISGRVLDAQTGDPLPGANVTVVDLAGTGTVTNVSGEYTLRNVPTRQQPYTLRASFIGYAQSEASVTLNQGGQTATANFELTEGIELARELVVVGLGIERQERELGYAVETIRGDEVMVGDNTNLLQSLSGRISGVDITQSSGSIGGSTRIILRGITSLSGDNQPLFVIDGVPISNANVAPTQGRLQGAVDTGNRANDINPADIESISVLKGGAAAALYGQRAKNGVILITTRRGVNRPRASVQASTSIVSNTVGRLPDFQNEYGPGTSGYYQNTSTSGWGPQIRGQQVTGSIIDPTQPYTLNAQPNNVRDFWETGLTSTNNLSFSTGTQTTDFRLGVGYINQGGIVPNSELDRLNLQFNAGTRLANGFNARATLNYVNSNDQGRAIQGGNEDTISGTVFSFPRTLDINDLRNYVDDQGNQRTYGQTGNNPFWIANENLFTSDINRIYGSGTVGFDPTDWLSFTARAGTDFYTQNRRQVYVPGTQGNVFGRFRDDILQSREINTDIFARVNRPINEDFSFQAIVGNNINQRAFRRNLNDAATMSVGGLYNYANFGTNAPENSSSLRRLIGFFGDVTLGWRDAVFLNVTGRNDISSTLPVANRSYFYPSASLSVVFTDLVDIDSNLLSYGKLRLNAARVGSDEAPYQLDFRFFPVSSVFGQFNTAVQFPYFGNTGFNASATVPPSDLRPQQQTTFEIGTELGFLNDRINLDFNFYDQQITDQILSLPTPYSTGFGFFRTNVGAVANTGFESTLNAQTVRIGDFSHSMRATFSSNNNRVVSLAEGLDFITLETGYNTIAIRAEVGEPLGLYGTGWQRDEATGLPIINENTGLREIGLNPIRLGSLDPNFRVGFGNTFRYGPVMLSALLDWKDGGVLYSQSVAAARSGGRAQETLSNRDGSIIDIGVICSNGECRPNDVPAVSMQSFWGALHSGSVQEAGTFDASYVKLREVVLGFDLPQSVLQRTPFGSATIALEGRNLALLYSRIPHIDPETNLFGSGTVGGAGYEFNNLPSTRQLGVNINVTF